MNTKVRWLLLSAILVLIANQGWQDAFAQVGSDQPDDRLYFDQHGHWVVGDFLTTFQSVTNPEQIFGYPITEAFLDQSRQQIVQYFERARFVYVPENPPELRVLISPLGELIYTPGEKLPIPKNNPSCRRFPETSYQVCYAFLDFFEENGGAAQFGYPISNFEIHDDRIVQYFQRARFEWHPDNLNRKNVQLANLGEEYFHTRGEDSNRLLPAQPPFTNGAPLVILDFKVRAFTERPTLSSKDEQTVYVLVQDHNLRPVPNAVIHLMIKFPDGRIFEMDNDGTTDKNGIFKYTFQFQEQPLGMAEVYVTATFDTFEDQAVTSFTIWK
ncbi:MAG: hypothetical protein PVF74_01185 [Anaerolineales bacterium]